MLSGSQTPVAPECGDIVKSNSFAPAPDGGGWKSQAGVAEPVGTTRSIFLPSAETWEIH